MQNRKSYPRGIRKWTDCSIYNSPGLRQTPPNKRIKTQTTRIYPSFPQCPSLHNLTTLPANPVRRRFSTSHNLKFLFAFPLGTIKQKKQCQFRLRLSSSNLISDNAPPSLPPVSPSSVLCRHFTSPSHRGQLQRQISPPLLSRAAFHRRSSLSLTCQSWMAISIIESPREMKFALDCLAKAAWLPTLSIFSRFLFNFLFQFYSLEWIGLLEIWNF